MTFSDQGASNAGGGQAEGPASSAFALKPGIYLEEKKGVIGTGGTAKTTDYRSFWATLSITEKSVTMLLLDDDFKPTSISKAFSLEDVSAGWHYIPQGQKRYERLRPYLERLTTPSEQKTGSPAKQKNSAQKWWEKEGGSEPADPFSLDKSKKAPAMKNGKWWEKKA